MISGFLCSVFKAIDLGHRKELSYSPQATDGQKGPERKRQKATTRELQRVTELKVCPRDPIIPLKRMHWKIRYSSNSFCWFPSLSFLKPLPKLSAFEAGKLYKPFSNTPNTPHQKHQIK